MLFVKRSSGIGTSPVRAALSSQKSRLQWPNAWNRFGMPQRNPIEYWWKGMRSTLLSALFCRRKYRFSGWNIRHLCKLYLTDFPFLSLSMMSNAFMFPNLVLYLVLPIFIIPMRWHLICLEQMKWDVFESFLDEIRFNRRRLNI